VRRVAEWSGGTVRGGPLRLEGRPGHARGPGGARAAAPTWGSPVTRSPRPTWHRPSRWRRSRPEGGHPEIEAATFSALVDYCAHARRCPSAQHVRRAGGARRRPLRVGGLHELPRRHVHDGRLRVRGALASAESSPGTDLLLHDMGQGLAESVSDRTVDRRGVAHAAALGARAPRPRERPSLPAPRRPRADADRGHPLARRRGAREPRPLSSAGRGDRQHAPGLSGVRFEAIAVRARVVGCFPPAHARRPRSPMRRRCARTNARSWTSCAVSSLRW
jgi:hypothetical protein